MRGAALAAGSAGLVPIVGEKKSAAWIRGGAFFLADCQMAYINAAMKAARAPVQAKARTWFQNTQRSRWTAQSWAAA